MRDYAAMTTLITQKLQSAGTSDWSVAEVDYQIEEGLKEFSNYRSHIVPVIFKIESRTGNDVTGTPGSLTDSVKSQFVSGDVGKMVYNTTDHTWAMINAFTSSSVVGLSVDIMDANESYAIFHYYCTNKRQIYIGSMITSGIVEYPRIDSVEYPIGTRRNWKLIGDVLEIDCDNIPDSNLNVTLGQPNLEVLVNFNRPHILSQLTDWAGFVASSAASGATSVAVSSLQSAGTIEIGEEFYIENKRPLFVVAASATIVANTAGISFYPGLDDAAGATETVTFRKSSLAPQDEELFARLVAGHLMQNKALKFINSIPTGGGEVSSKYYAMGTTMVDDALRELRMSVPSKTKKRWATD